MKVLLVHNAYQQPGGEDVAFEQEKALLELHGHQVVTYQRHNSELEGSSRWSRIAAARDAAWSSRSVREVTELIRREQPAVAHVHNTFYRISPSIYEACRQTGVPVVQTLHNFRLLCPAATFYREGAPCEECLERGTWRGVQHGCYRNSRSATAAVALTVEMHRLRGTWTRDVHEYVALTEFARSKFVAGGLPTARITVKPNFVNPDPGFHSSLGDYAVYVGRLSPEKGVRTLVRAWRGIGNGVPLLLVGDGPLREELERAAVESGLTGVTFAGRLKRAETLAAIQSARFLVLPSECYENFPMTVVEAMATGTPVIASRIGAIREIVADQRSGLLFAAGESADLENKVAWAWDHPVQMQMFSKEARQDYENKFSAARSYDLLMGIYAKAQAQHQPRVKTLSADAPARRYRVLGVPVDPVQIPAVITRMQAWISKHLSGRFIAVTGMHGVMEAQHDDEFRRVLNSADLVVADGMPLVWLGRWHGHAMARRVYGPELLETFCRQTRGRYRHFFYGGAPGVAERLAETLRRRFGIRVAGCFTPPFRALTLEEEEEVQEQVHQASPDVLWVGLSTPKQERWMFTYRNRLQVPVMVGVGAAFDFHTGRVRQAPRWMREHGLEWFYRLACEPRRLWRRYVIYGSQFVWHASLEILGVRKST